MTFTSFGFSQTLLSAISGLGYVEPTPVQLAAIPPILKGEDLWASAKTGSGKTAAFVLPLVERLLAGPRKAPARVLVIAPTRELALQIGEAVERTAGRALKCVVVVGGLSINPQMMALRGGADLVVGTPGRLLDLVGKNALKLFDVETLVLDEADRLLSLGFGVEMKELMSFLPTKRQTLFFSATFPPAVQKLAEATLCDPVRINLDAGDTHAADVITQRAIEVDEAKRTLLLRHLVETQKWKRVLVFVASRHAADHVASKLAAVGITASSLHGGESQGTRVRALDDFKRDRLRVLVATDVAARGLDIEKLPVVVNYDLPRSTADYVHRIGRTGRAGETGLAVSFVTAAASAHFRLIEKRHGMRLERERLAGFEPTDVAPVVLDPHGGIKGKRKSKKDKLRERGLL